MGWEEINWDIFWQNVGKCSKGKQHVMMLDEQTTGLNVGRMIDALKAIKDWDAWKVIIAYIKHQGTWLIDILVS